MIYTALRSWDGWEQFLGVHGVPTEPFDVPQEAVEAVVKLFIDKVTTLCGHTQGKVHIVFDGRAGREKDVVREKRHR